MDRFAASVANILVGNSAGAAVLEVTFIGPQLKFLQDTTIALTGADLRAKVEGHELPPWSSRAIGAGQVLTFTGRAGGARAYIALHGGLDVPIVLGSRSTDLKSLMGGYFGRALKQGDELGVCRTQSDCGAHYGGRSLRKEDLAEFRPSDLPIRFLRSSVEDPIIENFVNLSFTVRPDSDRMGFRLDGGTVNLKQYGWANTWSEPVAAGTIQIPPSGSPIILMADHQTVGGYPKMGTVITADIGRLAQISPGEPVRFSEVSLEEAHCLLSAEQTYLSNLSLANR
jgi:antagonist of KipI